VKVYIEEAVEFAGSIVEKIAPKKEVILVSSTIWAGCDNPLTIMWECPDFPTTKITIYKDKPSASIMALASRNVDRGRIVYTIYEDDKWLKAFQSDIFHQIILEAIGRGDVIYLTKNGKCWNVTALIENLLVSLLSSVTISPPIN
jgi:hypothetical protein